MLTSYYHFRQWLESDGNPLRESSELVQFHTADALRAAFEAGALAYKNSVEAKAAEAKRELERNIFEDEPGQETNHRSETTSTV